MFKIILLLLLFNSLLFSLSVERQNKEIEKINNAFKSQGNSMRIYKMDIINKTKTFTYSYEVEFTTAENAQQLMNDYCSSPKTRKAIDAGWTYKMHYRNKHTKKTVIDLTINKYKCN